MAQHSGQGQPLGPRQGITGGALAYMQHASVCMRSICGYVSARICCYTRASV